MGFSCCKSFFTILNTTIPISFEFICLVKVFFITYPYQHKETKVITKDTAVVNRVTNFILSNHYLGTCNRNCTAVNRCEWTLEYG